MNKRVIKFRAWDEKTKHMYYDSGHVVLESKGECYNLQTGEKLIPLFFIGLLDKNKREIYEGDIVKTAKGYVGDYYIDSALAEVKFEPPDFILLTNKILPDNHWTDCEVIGNIYENTNLPKLLDF